MTATASENAASQLKRRSRLLYGGAPYLLLIVSTMITLLTPSGQDGGGRLVTLAIAAAAGAWLALPLIVAPDWPRHRMPILVFYLVLLAIIATLLTRNAAYTLFASVGYGYALGMLPPRLIVWGVTVTAVTTAVTQSLASDASSPVSRYMLAVNLAVPLLFVGWYIGLQNARRNEIIIELRESNSQLQEALQENRGLHAQLLAQAKDAGVREERQRMAREIHDTIAQDLTGVVTQLEAAVHRSGDDGARQRYIRNATQLAREGLAEARRSVLALRPEVLEVSGLPEAIAQTAARWSGLHGTEATLNITGTAATLDSDMEVTLLRVAQEALANVAKHSGADRVTMTLTYLGDTVILDICDDGLGFEPSAASGSVRRDGGAGLIGMRERIERLSGQLEIESSPGSGCIVSASLPVPGTRAPGDQGDTVG